MKGFFYEMFLYQLLIIIFHIYVTQLGKIYDEGPGVGESAFSNHRFKSAEGQKTRKGVKC